MFISTDFGKKNELPENDFTDVHSEDGDDDNCDEPCNSCGTLLLPDQILRCPCKNALYCSTQCQASDWPAHQTRCSAASMEQSVEICSNCRRTSTTLCVCRCGKTFYCDRRCQRKHWHRHAHMCACRVQKNQVGYTRPTSNKAVQVGGDFDGCSNGNSFISTEDRKKSGVSQSFSNGGTPIILTGPMAGLSLLVGSSAPQRSSLANTTTTSAVQTQQSQKTSVTASTQPPDGNGLTPSKTRNPLAMLLRSTSAFKSAGPAAGGGGGGESSTETSTSSLSHSKPQPFSKGIMAKVGGGSAADLPSFGDDAEADDFTLDLSSAHVVQNKSRINSLQQTMPSVGNQQQSFARQRAASSVNFVQPSTKAAANVSNLENNRSSSKENLLESTSQRSASGSRRASTVLKFSSKNPYVFNDVVDDSPRRDDMSGGSSAAAAASPRKASVTMEHLLSVHPANCSSSNPLTRQKSPTTTPNGTTPLGGGGSFLQRNQFNSVNMSMNKIGIPNALAISVYEDLDDPWVNLPMGATLKEDDIHGRKLVRKSVLIVRR
jgi:hypothetical protein